MIATLMTVAAAAAEAVEEVEHSDPVSDGKHILYGMLITALVFLAVIGIGEYTRWAGRRRALRKHAAQAH